ncbi:MAG: hypothetical protein M0D55_09930 [Elusimicrobiota bacterium]|nr:MAG: hypothetical protein M0D55_09930 [Elusimicrobiota bacterium]
MIVAQTSDVPPNIGSDVLFIAAVGTKPGDFSMGKACRIKGVHGGLGRRTQSEIMMVGDPGPDEPLTRPDLRGNPVPSSWALTKRMVERGEICLLRPDTEYFYSIAGDCDWGRIESQRERLGKEPNGPKHGCPVRLSNNNFFLLAPGRNQERK